MCCEMLAELSGDKAVQARTPLGMGKYEKGQHVMGPGVLMEPLFGQSG
jgi:hypothetical protein